MEFLNEAELNAAPVSKGTGRPAYGTDFMSEQEATGQAPKPPTFLDNLQGFLTDSDSWKEMGRRAAQIGAGTADLILGSPGMAASAVANLGGRTVAAIQGKSRKDVEESGRQARAYIPEGFIAPLQTAAHALGLPPLDQSGMEAVMNAAGDTAEKYTKGIISDQDAKDMLEMVMLKGVLHAGKTLTDVTKAGIDKKYGPAQGQLKGLTTEQVKSNFKIKYKNKFGGEGASPEESITFDPTEYAPKTPEVAVEASKARIKALEKRKEVTSLGVPQILGGPALWKSSDSIDRPVNVMGAAESGPDGKYYTPVNHEGHDIYVPTAELTRVAPEPQVGLPKPATPPDLFPPAEGVEKTHVTTGTVLGEQPDYLASGIAKLKAGQGFLMGTEERLAVRATAKAGGNIVGPDGKPLGPSFTERGEIDPRLLAALGVTSAAVWGALHPEDMEKLAGMGLIGATMMSGKARSVAALVKEGAPYHFETMLKLPQGATELGRQQVLDTAAKFPSELPIVQRVLAAIPEGKRVTATALHEGLMEEAAGWKLEPKETGQYADYGIANLGRVTVETPGSRLMGETVTPATTTLFRLPEHMQVSDANHFGEARYFGHTRSFKETVPEHNNSLVTHVVELQSDLAQHAKALTAERQAELRTELKRNADRLSKLNEESTNVGYDPENSATPAAQETLRLATRQHEIKAALAGAETAKVVEPISPILKNWPRRLIRETLLKAVKNGEDTVRFASADTVAKVEGWPRNSDAGELTDPADTATARPNDFQDPGHQTIYNRYAGEITRYLKGLGGKEVTDAQGHTWWEVPTDSARQSYGPGIKMLGAADPKLLAKLGAGVALGAYLIAHPNESEKVLLGMGLGIAIKGGVKGVIDAELLSHIQEGGAKAEAATAELYRRYAPQMTRTLQGKFGRQGVDIDEAVQDGFFHSLRVVAKGHFRGDAEFSTYLHRAVVNRALNQLRAAKSRPDTVSLTEDPNTGRSALADTLGHDDTPANRLQSRDLGVQIDKALDSIDPRFRDAFLAVERDGLSYEEAAAQQGIPINTLRSRIYRAKAAMQEQLAEYQKGAGLNSTPGDSSTPAKPRMGDYERGSADPKTLAAVAALAGGAALGVYLNPDSPITSGAFGAGIAALLLNAKPRAWGEAFRRVMTAGPVIKIDQLIADTTYGKKVMQRAVYKMTTRIEDAVPEVVRREAIYDFLEGERPTKLTPTELKVAGEVRDFYNELGKASKDAGVVKQLLHDYATRIYPKNSRGFFEGPRVGGDTGLDSPFGKLRGFKTRAQAEAAGYVPVTTDIARVLEVYSDSVGRAINNRRFIETLKGLDAGGNPLMMKENASPKDYVYIDHPQMRGYRVHPDIASSLRMVFDTSNPGVIVGAMDAINSTQKRMGVSLSLFHATALEHAMLGATSFMKSPGRGLRIAAQSFAPAIFGENLAIKMIREGGVGDGVDYAMHSGVEFSFERQGSVIAEERPGFYQGLEAATTYLDATIPKLGTYSTGALLSLNKAFDRAMWGRFHAALKLETFLDKASELSRNNAREVANGKAALKSREEVGKMAASFANDVYGGLNYAQMVGEFSQHWTRKLAAAAFSPTGRLGMRLLMFAPDWTISTTRAFVKAFGPREMAVIGGAIVGAQVDPEHYAVGALGGAMMGAGMAAGLKLKGTNSSGIRGLLHPTELADLHRQYILRSAFIYTTLVDGLNYQMSGHHFWQNKNDPTRLDRGDGTSQQVSKHFMEPFHWLLDPKKQAMGKASFLVKEAINQIEDREYWTPAGAPRMGAPGVNATMDERMEWMRKKALPVSIGTRIKHVAKQFTPITAQGFSQEKPMNSVASLLGAPIYGKMDEEKATAKRQLKQLHNSPEYRRLQRERKLAKQRGER